MTRNDKEKKRVLVRAIGFWYLILWRISTELRRALKKIGGPGPCPFKEHPKSKDAFKLFDDVIQTGGGICNTCGAYPDGISLLMKVKSWTLSKCLEEVEKCIDSLEAEGIERVEEVPQERDVVDEAAWEKDTQLIFDKLEDNKERIAAYFKDRGLSGCVPDSIYFYKKMECYSNKKLCNFDAMVACVQNVNEDVVALHYTYLSNKDSGKAKISIPKRFSRVIRKGALKGAAIYLGEPAETMGIAEGIETALAVSEATGTPMMVTPSNVMKYAEFPLVVKCVQIWADNDSSGVGAKAANALAERLVEKGYKVYCMMPPSVGTDWLDVTADLNRGPETIVMAQNEAKQYVMKQEDSESYKKPLQREKEAPIAFPIEALGEFLSKVAKTIKDITQAPEALCGQSILAVASLVVQGIANLALMHGERPLSCFFFTLGESGERKSTVDDIALKPVREYEASCRPVHKAKLAAYLIQKEQYEKKMREACNSESMHEEESVTDSVDMPPMEPYGASMIVGDPTIEGLMNFMKAEQPSIGLFSDEGARVVGGHGLQQDAKLRTAAGLSVLWDGKSLSSQRAGGSIIVSGKRLSVHLMMQAEVSEKFLGDEIMKSQGILSRILITEPESTIGTRFFKSPGPDTAIILNEYNLRILEILQREYTFKKGTEFELDPRPLPLSTEATEVYIEFHNEVEAQLSEKGAYSEIRGFASKAPEHAARLAGILTLIEDINAPEISKEKMVSGVALGRYYLHEAKRQFVANVEDPTIACAKQVLKWMQQTGEQNHALVEIYQKGPQGVRTADKAREALYVLEEHGWVKQVKKMEINGKMRRDVWQLVE